MSSERPAEFLSDPEFVDITEGRQTQRYRLRGSLSVYSAVLDRIITVPDGFEFDGESIPAILQWLVKRFGYSKRGAAVHDYLYRLGGYRLPNGTLQSVTRRQADDVYAELLKIKGLPAWRANARWLALRIAGRAAWNANARDRIQTHAEA